MASLRCSSSSDSPTTHGSLVVKDGNHNHNHNNNSSSSEMDNILVDDNQASCSSNIVILDESIMVDDNINDDDGDGDHDHDRPDTCNDTCNADHDTTCIPTQVAIVAAVSAATVDETTPATTTRNEKEEYSSARHEFISRILDNHGGGGGACGITTSITSASDESASLPAPALEATTTTSGLLPLPPLPLPTPTTSSAISSTIHQLLDNAQEKEEKESELLKVLEHSQQKVEGKAVLIAMGDPHTHTHTHTASSIQQQPQPIEKTDDYLSPTNNTDNHHPSSDTTIPGPTDKLCRVRASLYPAHHPGAFHVTPGMLTPTTTTGTSSNSSSREMTVGIATPLGAVASSPLPMSLPPNHYTTSFELHNDPQGHPATNNYNSNCNDALEDDLEQGCCSGDNDVSTTTDPASSSSMDLTTPIEAVAVDEDEQKAQLERQIRQSIYQEAVQAAQVEIMMDAPDNNNNNNHNNNHKDNDHGDNHARTKSSQEDTKPQRTCGGLIIICLVVAVVLVVALGVGLGVGLSQNQQSNDGDIMEQSQDATSTDTSSSVGTSSTSTSTMVDDQPSLSTLERVRQRGYVRCGMTEFSFATLSSHDSNVNSQTKDRDLFSKGFNVEQCKAMALMALGDPTKYEQVFCDHYTRFSYLANGTIDVMTEGATFTMQRNVYIDTFKSGYSFTDPYFYSGLKFAGQPKFVDCADDLESFYDHCRELRICVLDGSTHIAILRKLIQGSVIVAYNGTESLLQHLSKETCNVAAGELLFLLKVKELFLNSSSLTTNNTEAEHWKFGSRVASKEPLSVVTRNNDPEWSTLANLMVNGLILAEANNITKENASEMATLFENGINVDQDGPNSTNGDDLASLLISLIATFGNHGDLYKQEIESQIPRNNALNRPYDKYQTTGLLYSTPFGVVDEYGPDPVTNGTLDVINQRGFLVCGVQTFRGAAFARNEGSDSNHSTADWAGFDVEICRGIAGSLFAGNRDRIAFVELKNTAESYAALANEEVDVVAGSRVTLQAMYREPTTGRGYSFSPRYYFDNIAKEGYALMTRSNDVQWNDFVYWIVTAVVFAEEEDITSRISADMPVVTLFGERLKQAFRDCISSVGSYGELYNNTLEDFIPRTGANRLNYVNGYHGAQMMPIPPN